MIYEQHFVFFQAEKLAFVVIFDVGYERYD